MSAPSAPTRFGLSAMELADIVTRAAQIGIARWRIYAALDIRQVAGDPSSENLPNA